MIRLLIVLLLAACIFSSFKPKEITWVAIGDSITYLNDHTNETGNRVKKGYMTRVVENIVDLKYINKGFNGWTSGDIAGKIDKLGLEKADVFSVFLGTNDWWQGRPIGTLDDYKNNRGNSTLYGSFRIILDKLHSLNPEAKILLITPLQRADFVYINDHANNAFGSYRAKNGQLLEAFANAIDSIAQYEHVSVVDLYHDTGFSFDQLVNFKRLKDPQTGEYINYKYPKAAEVPFDSSTDDYPYPIDAVNLTFDGLHPSDKGNAIIANRIEEKFLQFGLSAKHPLDDEEIGNNQSQSFANLDQYLKPFWKADTIIDESAQAIKDSIGITAKLLFKAKKILSVRTSDNSKVFVSGTDWVYKNGMLVFSSNSRVPSLSPAELLFVKKPEVPVLDGKLPGTYVAFRTGAYFYSKQILVTYIKEKASVWKGPIPVYKTAELPVTIDRLRNHQKLKVEFYGDSIEAGYNESGKENVPPYMPTWPELIVDKLQKVYRGQIDYVNKSVAGKLSKWGRDSVSTRVVAEHPDLVILGFGMNDGTLKVAPDDFRSNIQSIIDSVTFQNPKTEFILIAPMLANPASSFSGLQDQYKKELDKLKRVGVIVADMTGVHQELLKHKSYQDMTGNNINHPNDYLARWYAQIICGYLIK